MKYSRFLPLIFFPAIVAYAANANHGNGRPRGQSNGDYTLTVAGLFAGSGNANISKSTISFTAIVKFPDGSTATLIAPSLTIINGHFKGTGSLGSAPCSIDGRIDLPSAQDGEQNDDQAITARLIASIIDSFGRTARIVGIQDPASRGPAGGTPPAPPTPAGSGGGGGG